MPTMSENHIAWMKKEVANLAEQIRFIEDKKGRFYSQHGREPRVEITQPILIENKRKKAELEDLLKQHGIE